MKNQAAVDHLTDGGKLQSPNKRYMLQPTLSTVSYLMQGVHNNNIPCVHKGRES